MVNTDTRIAHTLSLFEDVQFHLEQLGYKSVIRERQLIFIAPMDLGGTHREFSYNGMNFFIYSNLADSWEGKTVLLPPVIKDICIFLSTIFPFYRKAKWVTYGEPDEIY